jgi:hypothetical protein
MLLKSESVVKNTDGIFKLLIFNADSDCKLIGTLSDGSYVDAVITESLEQPARNAGTGGHLASDSGDKSYIVLNPHVIRAASLAYICDDII